MEKSIVFPSFLPPLLILCLFVYLLVLFFLLNTISSIPFLYVDLAVPISASDGSSIIFLYFLCSISSEYFNCVIVFINFNILFLYTWHFNYYFNVLICCRYIG